MDGAYPGQARPEVSDADADASDGDLPIQRCAHAGAPPYVPDQFEVQPTGRLDRAPRLPVGCKQFIRFNLGQNDSGAC